MFTDLHRVATFFVVKRCTTWQNFVWLLRITARYIRFHRNETVAVRVQSRGTTGLC